MIIFCTLYTHNRRQKCYLSITHPVSLLVKPGDMALRLILAMLGRPEGWLEVLKPLHHVCVLFFLHSHACYSYCTQSLTVGGVFCRCVCRYLSGSLSQVHCWCSIPITSSRGSIPTSPISTPPFVIIHR